MNEKERETATKNIRTAVSMHLSSQVLWATSAKEKNGTKEELERGNGLILGANILAPFGIENALKALIRREGKDPKKDHNLRKLYDKLAPGTQQRICEKVAAMDIGVRVEGVIDEHQNSFEEWRYRDGGEGLIADPDALAAILQALIQIYNERYGEDIKREKRQGTGQLSQAMTDRVNKYLKKVRMPKSG